MLDQVVGADRARASRLDDKALRTAEDGIVIDAPELDGKGLTQVGDDANVNGPFARDGTFKRRLCGVERGLAADKAHAGSCGHGARGPALDDGAGSGVLGREAGEELVELVVVSELEQVALAHGLVQAQARPRGAPAFVVGLEAARVSQRPASQHLANDLSAVVRALVAHHLVAGAPLLILGGKVAVKAALELAVARLGDLGRDGAPGEDVVKLGAVRAHDGVDVIGGPSCGPRA